MFRHSKVVWVVLSVAMVAGFLLWSFQITGNRVGMGARISDREPAISEPAKDIAPDVRQAPEVLEPSAGVAEDSRVASSPAKSALVAADTPHIGPAGVGPAGIVDDSPRVAVRRVLAERWLDPETKDSRRRVRVVETDFKYPLLRIEDEVVRAPDGSKRSVFRKAAVADHVMVGLKDGTRGIKDRLEQAGVKIRGQGKDSFLLVEVANAGDPDALPDAVAKLRQDFPEAAYIEPDPMIWALTFPNDPRLGAGTLWGLHNPGGRSGYAVDADIDAPEGWETMHDAPGTVVAVIDTGIRYTHEDLAANIWTNAAEVPGNGIDDDGNGVIDDIHGYDAANEDGDPMDDQGHGTHCAGTIGAVGNNGKGITGVAWSVKLMAVKFLTANGGGTTSDAILSIDYARLNGANVINASWGGGPYHAGLFSAIRACGNAGIPFVAAAGNDSANNDATPHYPSSYNSPNIVAVAATGTDDRLASFSCYGKISVDIAAPGVDIVSTFHTSDQAYKSLSGTSMAAPHVSGMLALARAKFPLDKDHELLKRLTNSADLLPSLANLAGKGHRANLHGLLGSSSPTDPETGAPLNDNLVNAERIDGAYTAWAGSNANATREPGESSFNPAKGDRTVWLAWEAPTDGIADLTLDADPQGQGLRVVVFKVTGSNALTVVADSGKSAGKSGTARLRFSATADSDHRIAISSNTDDGQFLTLGITLRPSNDNLADATLLTGERFAASGTTFGATAEPFEILNPHAESGAGKSVWWKWTAPFTGPFVLTTEGSEFDTVLAVYQPGVGGNPPMEVAANDDAGPLDGSSALEFNAIAGSTYLMAVDSYRIDSQGPCKLNGFRPGPPQILSQPADVEVALGGRATFSVGAGGALRLEYQWFKDGIALPGQTARTLVIDPVRNQDLGGYWVEVSNGRETTTSGTALLREKLLAPKITWTSGNQGVVLNATIDLRVQVSGSQPMSFQWSKDGTIIGGAESAAFTQASATTASSGTYTCRVTNSVGSASASMLVTVVQSPFESWEWRLDAFQGPSINEIKVIEGQCYAVAGHRILVSADASNWRPWPLPPGFQGMSIEKLGNRWLCSGFNAFGSGRCAISTDGVNWVLQTPTGLPGTDGSTSLPMHHVTRLVSLNGRFIGQTARSGTIYGAVVTSADGIAWTNATLTGTSTQISVAGPFVTGPAMILAGNSMTNANQPAQGYRSTDGMTWESFALPNPVGQTPVYNSSQGAMRWNGQYVLFSGASGGYGGWVSPNGTDWTQQSGFSWTGGIDFNGAFVSLGGAVFDGLAIAWAPNPWTAKSRFIKPATGDVFSASAAFNNRVVYGTKRGFVGSLASAEEFLPIGASTGTLNQITFLDGQFIAANTSDTGITSPTCITSGDGFNWKRQRIMDVGRGHTLVGYVGNRFWGRNLLSGAVSPATGLLPHALVPATVSNGLPANLISMAKQDGVALAIAGGALHRSTDEGQSWAPVVGAPAFGSAQGQPQVFRLGTRWFLTNAAPTYSYETGFVFQSTDGLAWTKTTAKGVSLTQFGNKLYALDPKSPTTGLWNGWQSTDGGLGWTQVTQHATNRLTTDLSLRHLGTFGSSLVAHLTDGGLWFSNDGASWFRANAPFEMSSMTTGLGQCVGITSSGAIVQAGVRPTGGNAPVVKIDYPIHLSAALEGSWVEVTGNASDPEGGALTVECRLDGAVLDTAAAGDFKFRFRATSTSAGHIIQVRATDSAGLVGADGTKIQVSKPQLDNLFDSGEGKDFLPSVALLEFNGMFYAAGSTGLRTSPDGITWSPVLLPGLTAVIKGMAAGNGCLVVQVDGGVLYTTRDGINWVRIGSNLNSSYWVYTPVQFLNGRFVIFQQVSGQVAHNIQTSVNGLDWTSAGNTQETYQIASGTNGVLVALLKNGFYSGAGIAGYWSIDNGQNWNLIPEIQLTGNGPPTFALVEGGGTFLVAASDGRLWRSADGKSWTSGTLPTLSGSGVSLLHVNGRFFAGNDTHMLFASMDGIGWTPISGSLRKGTVIHALGRFIGRGETGMVWSDDGFEWKQATGGPLTTVDRRIAATANRVIAIDANGAAWSSTDGESWTQNFAGRGAAGATASQLGQDFANLGTRMLLCGHYGMLQYSDDQGSSWRAASLGGQAVPADYFFRRLEAGGGVAMGVAVRQSTFQGTWTGNSLIRSTDGEHWSEVTELASIKPKDVSTDGAGNWLVIGWDGAVMRSTDHGQSWSTVNGPVMARGNIAAWQGGQWVLIGSVLTNSPPRVWTSSDAAVWADQGEKGWPSGYEMRRISGHGRLAVWSSTSDLKFTLNGTTWQAMTGYNPWASYTPCVVARPSGFLLISPGSGTNLEFFPATVDFQVGPKVTPYLSDTASAATSDGENLFIFAAGKITRWSENDLTLDLADFTTAPGYGVGDSLNVQATIRNRGVGSVPAGDPLPVDAWLSSDGFFGDGNDIYVGRVDLPVAPPAPGQEVAVDLQFTLPDTIAPGTHHVVLRLDTQGRLDEANRANNTALSRTACVNIAQWQLNMQTQGSGEVLQTSARRFYPHKASIGLFARAGKGAAFGGWGGDAVGGLSETSVLMDGDKNVTATFVAQASLRVVAIGNGTLNVPNSGTVPLGSNVVLLATPAAGWEFDRWEGAVSGTAANVPLTVDDNKVVRAWFRQSVSGWKQQHFNAAELAQSAISGDDADPDGDGVPNWQEFAHGSKPLDPGSTGRGTIERDGNEMVVVFTRHQNPADGTRVDCQAARTLADWGPDGLVLQVLDQSEGVETVEARFPIAGHNHGFIRFAYSRPAP